MSLLRGRSYRPGREPDRRQDPPDETSIECPECFGSGADSDGNGCDRCDGEGFIDTAREAKEAREEWAERMAEADENRV